MCLVCIDLVKQKMTVIEADRNLGELIYTTPDQRLLRHYKDLKEALENLDVPILDTFFSRVKDDSD